MVIGEMMLWLLFSIVGVIIFSFQLYISKDRYQILMRLDAISSQLEALKKISKDTEYIREQQNILVARVLEEHQRREEQEKHLLTAIEQLRRERR